MDLTRFSTEVCINSNIDTDKQSVILQYDKFSDLTILQNYVRSSRRQQSTTVINNWIVIDGFVNLDYKLDDKPENRCVRIIYECLENNSEPSPLNGRFGNCYILHVDTSKLREELKLYGRSEYERLCSKP